MHALVETIDRFGLATSSQLLRLHYQGTKSGTRVRQNTHLRKLVQRGLVRRLPYRSTTNAYGAAEFVYTPPTSTLEVMRPHMHDILELYVRLSVFCRGHSGYVSPGDVVDLREPELQYDPEEWGRRTWGSVELHPDALVKIPSIPKASFFLEVDLSTERPSVLAAKMNRYVQAFNSMDGGKFPYVLWTCRSQTRLRTIRSVIRARSIPEMFKVCLFEEAVPMLLGEKP